MPNFHFSPRTNRAREIHWHEWNASTFDEARQQDKPMLLDISAVWCHWCHVMDETTYSDPEIIALVNEQFIPVRVDTDERPDVNRRYNLGGWPTTAFLSPEGELLTGGTYLAPTQMRSYLTQLSEVYRDSKDQIRQKIAEVNAKRDRTLAARAASPARVGYAIVEDILQEVVNNFDSAHGGFGDEPKFPSTDALALALENYYASRDPTLLNVVNLTLTNMASGGMYDQVWGGFFRYSTTRDWSVPHYEKMLEDNAKLLALYLHAWQVTREELFLKTARASIAYVDLTLSDHTRGGFYGSQDADETYYTLPRQEREQVPAPFIDHTFFTDWNALMVSAYLLAAQILPESTEPLFAGGGLQAFALKTLDRLWTEMFRPGEGLYHSAKPDAAPQLANQLIDLARTALALLDAYEATGENVYWSRAQTLADLALGQLVDETTQAFWSEPPRAQALGLLRVPDKSMNDNAVMAEALTRLYRLGGEEKYRTAAGQALAYFSADYGHSSFMAAEYALAVDHLLTEPVSVHIIGGLGDAGALRLQAAALEQYAPNKIVQLLDPRRDAARLAQLGYPHNGSPLAYVCVGTKCLAPVGDPQGIVAGIQEMAEQP
jgi:uncharacterized protein